MALTSRDALPRRILQIRVVEHKRGTFSPQLHQNRLEVLRAEPADDPPHSGAPHKLDFPDCLVGYQRVGDLRSVLAAGLHHVQDTRGAAGVLEYLDEEVMCSRAELGRFQDKGAARGDGRGEGTGGKDDAGVPPRCRGSTSVSTITLSDPP